MNKSVIIKKMVLKYFYIIFIGVLLVIFVGVGIAAFYEGPKQPELSADLKYLAPDRIDATPSAEFVKKQEEVDNLWKLHQQRVEEYNKNVSIIAISTAILILIISLTMFKKILLIADGFLLGGVLTLLYSIIRSFQSQDFKYIFVVVSIGLALAIFLGYLKFIKPQTKKSK